VEPAIPLPDGALLSLLVWLEQRGGLAGALLVATLWLLTLLRERAAFRRRNDALSDALCEAIENGSSERARMADEYRLGHDWTVRSLLEHFHALAAKPAGGVQSTTASRSSLQPPPKPPTVNRASDHLPRTTPAPNQPMTPPTISPPKAPQR